MTETGHCRYKFPKQQGIISVKIENFVLALDGGTRIIDLRMDSGELVVIGLDGRMDSPNSGKQLFIGGSADSPDAQLLPVGGDEEAGVIALLEQWLENQGVDRREVLINSDHSLLHDQDLLDRMAMDLLEDLKNRLLDNQR